MQGKASTFGREAYGASHSPHWQWPFQTMSPAWPTHSVPSGTQSGRPRSAASSARSVTALHSVARQAGRTGGSQIS